MARQILPKGGGQLRQPGSGPLDSPEELEHLGAGLHRVVHGYADTGGAHLEALDGAGSADLGATPWWGTVWCPSGTPATCSSRFCYARRVEGALLDPVPALTLTLASPGMAGHALTRAREAQAMTIDAVSDRLLLSTRQVRGLETGETSAFHNTAFYGRALEKYAAFLGVAPVGVGPALPTVLGRRAAAAEQPRLSLAAYPSGHDINPRRARASLTVAVALGTCLVLGILVFWRAWRPS